jgi:hypothetical protein
MAAGNGRPETILTPVTEAHGFPTRDRILVLYAWAEIDGDRIESESGALDVIGMVTFVRDGRLSVEPIVIFDGQTTYLEDLRQTFLRGHADTEVVYADWAKHLDEDQLGDRLQRLQKSVMEDAKSNSRI